MSKGTMPIIAVMIILAVIQALLVFETPALSDAASGKCGEGICDEFEKACPEVCPRDWKASRVGEGGSILVAPNAPSCRKGLSLIWPKDTNIVGSSGICTSKCGNEVCASETETAHNCPGDFGNPVDPFRDKIWDLYDYSVNYPDWEGTDWHNAQPMVTYEGTAYRMYLYRFMKKGGPVYVGWFDCFNVRECSVMRIDTGVELDFDKNTKNVKVTKAVSKDQSGKSVFETETKAAMEGKVTIRLREAPVFVEEE